MLTIEKIGKHARRPAPPVIDGFTAKDVETHRETHPVQQTCVAELCSSAPARPVYEQFQAWRPIWLSRHSARTVAAHHMDRKTPPRSSPTRLQSSDDLDELRRPIETADLPDPQTLEQIAAHLGQRFSTSGAGRHRRIADLARERCLDPRWVTPLDGAEYTAVTTHWRGGSVRRLRRLVEASCANGIEQRHATDKRLTP